MDSLAQAETSGDRPKRFDLLKPESSNKSLIIPDSDAEEEKSKTPLAETHFGGLDEALSLRSQLYSLQVDDAISLCISILRSSIAINGINDETISEQVRIALRYLTKLPDPEPDNNFALDRLVYEYNGLDTLMELVRQPNLKVSLDAIRALYRVASVDRYTNLAVDASVPKTVVEILSNPSLITDNRTVCDGLLLLGNMAFNAEARAAIGDHNGIKVILSLLRNNRSNVEISDQCCYALANLAVSSHCNSQAMVDGNAIDEIIRIMSMHSRDVQLLESATFVLTNLCTDGEQPRMQIVSAGGGRILGQVLHNHANVPRLMKAVLRTLGNLACSALAVTTLLKDGLIPILMAKVHNQTAVRELELVVLVLSNMAIEGDLDTLSQLASSDGDVISRLIGMCSHPTILMVVVGFIDTLITRYEPFAERVQTWDMLMPLLVQSLPVLSQPSAVQQDLMAAGANQEGAAPEDALERLERLRLESIQHVYHAVGMLAAMSSTAKDHVDHVADIRIGLYKTLDEAAEVGSPSGPVLDCVIQAIWCLARLTTRISYMEIERDQVVIRLLRLFGVLIGLIDNDSVNTEIWAAIGGILRVLAQLATLHRSICSYISRYSMPAITRAFIMFTERKPQPDPETSAAFAGLLSCMTSTTTSLVHLGVDLAEAICRLLQTATNEDGTLTVASAASFIVLLSKMAANDRRGNIRAALNPSVLVKVMKALQSGAASQFQGADQTSIHDLVEACQSLQIVLDAPSLQAPSPTSTSPLTPVRNIRSIPKKTFLQIVHSPTSAQESVRRASQIVNPAALVASVKVQQRYRRRSSAMFNPRRKTSSDLGDIPDRTDSLASLSCSDHGENSSSRSWSSEPNTRLWASMLDECGSSADRLRAHSRVQETVMQNGIPDMYRGQVWRTLSGSEDLRRCYDPDYYSSLVKIVEEHGNPAQTEIRKDIRRTLPFTDLFKTETGIQKLERVLSAYCLRNSETVGYCQSMNNLCGALLTILSEEDAFWVLSCMIETRVGYYCKSMCALLRDQLVLKDLLSFQQPALYDHLVAHGVNIDTFTVSWFLCLFMEAPVPFTETMMVWDAILLFGDEMIFLFALEIFKRCSTQILELKSESELLVYFLRGLPHDIPSVQTMLGTISVGSISARIATLREVHEKTVAANCMQIRPSTLLNVEDHHYYDFSEVELAQLWKAFLSPSPWHILLHASIPNSTWLQYALKHIVFDTTSSLWRDHGLVSGLMDRLFIVADTNRTSHIDFEEFLVVAHILLKGTNEMRMQFAFAFADRDEDEMVSKRELYDMIVMLEATYNGWESAEAGAQQFVESVFDAADTSVTALDIDEFCHFALVHPLIASFFKLQAGVIPAKWTR